VASGCTDRTVEIARRFEAKNALVRVVEQPVREGKASAINQFLNYTTAEIVVLINGDTLPKEDTIEKLVEPFHDPLVGMTGGRAIPVNLKDRFMGFAVHLMWNLHDRVAQRTPKLGEVVAWRRFIGFVPPETAVDELSIEVLFTNMGYKLAYQPEAIVHNRGPETIRDFLKQRRRIHAGHLQILRLHGYRAATINNRTVLRSLLESISWQPRWLVWAAATVALEVAGRALGRYDYYTKKSYTIWQRIETTKNLISAEETDVA
jgi:cellulose synthase/poly-beta-1,6-N-acetylglucosamine synthase-like glycosyltransferase